MLKSLCSIAFKLGGWKFINEVPDDLKSFVMIGAPHTSNYDLIPTLAVSNFMNKNAKFVIKSEWTRFPFGLILRPAGAIGLDRSALINKDRESMTDVMANLFTQYKELVLMISPEGTRSPNSKWKTGFYYIAQKARVPLVLGYVDYQKKVAGLGKVMYLKDFEQDMRAIMEFYKDKIGQNPLNFKLDERYL